MEKEPRVCNDLFLLKRQISTARKNKDTGLQFTGLLLRWRQWSELNQSETRNNFLVFHLDAGAQELELFLLLPPGHKQGAASEVERPGLEPVPLWDLSTTGQGLTHQVSPQDSYFYASSK